MPHPGKLSAFDLGLFDDFVKFLLLPDQPDRINAHFYWPDD